MIADHLHDWAALDALRDRMDAAYRALRDAVGTGTPADQLAAGEAVEALYVELRHWNATGQAYPARHANPQPSEFTRRVPASANRSR